MYLKYILITNYLYIYCIIKILDIHIKYIWIRFFHKYIPNVSKLYLKLNIFFFTRALTRLLVTVSTVVFKVLNMLEKPFDLIKQYVIVLT